jgi:hypothetical protein
MGYSYGRNGRGNMVLSCDGCGDLGGVRKRTCPYEVLTDSSRGPRARLRYCYPPALCGGCYSACGGLRGVHGARCRDGAASSQEEYDARQAKLDAGELMVMAAWGDWQKGVPDGLVGVVFRGADQEAWRLVPEAAYEPGARPWLSDYPGAAGWEEHP